MKHKQIYNLLIIIITLIVGCYIGISIYLILHQSSEIELLKREKHGYNLKVKELEDMIISARRNEEMQKISPYEKKDKDEIHTIPLKYKELEAAILDFLNTQQYIPDFLPVADFILTKPYLPSRNHYGIDLAGKVGDPIFAAASGVVKEIKMNDEIYGKTILIDHLNGYKTFYGHNSEILAQEGFFIRKGDIIAELGNTGISSAPHLHFEILFKSEHIDPEILIRK
ncbi:MAG: M23 family metallopeptidase [Candidatus Cloacimonetes bacterium]|nr:M23 family metallopeptidase [Candidatus Cloacimonadota bacterium]